MSFVNKAHSCVFCVEVVLLNIPCHLFLETYSARRLIRVYSIDGRLFVVDWAGEKKWPVTVAKWQVTHYSLIKTELIDNWQICWPIVRNYRFAGERVPLQSTHCNKSWISLTFVALTLLWYPIEGRFPVEYECICLMGYLPELVRRISSRYVVGGGAIGSCSLAHLYWPV